MVEPVFTALFSCPEVLMVRFSVKYAGDLVPFVFECYIAKINSKNYPIIFVSNLFYSAFQTLEFFLPEKRTFLASYLKV